MNKSDVVLYIADIRNFDTERLFAKYGTGFSKHRLVRISKCKNASEKKKLVATGVLLEYVFSTYGYDASEIIIDDNGKPFIINNDAFFFNVSHSGAYVTVAVSGQAVGVDIQKYVDPSAKVVERVCTREEIATLGDISRKDFAHVWSVKEAAAKLDGAGIGMDMRRFSFDINAASPEVMLDNEHFCHIARCDRNEEYALSVACHDTFEIKGINKISI